MRRRRSLMLRLRLRARGRSLFVNRRLGAFFLSGRWCLTHRGLRLLPSRRWCLAHRRLSLLPYRRRRRLAYRRLSLFPHRRNVLRSGGRNGLGTRGLGGHLPRSGLGLRRALGWPLGKAWRGTGVHSRCHRMNLLGIDRLDLHARGRGILPGDLGAQGL